MLPYCYTVHADTAPSATKMQYITHNAKTKEETFLHYDISPPAELANHTLTQPGFSGISSLQTLAQSSNLRDVPEDRIVENCNSLPYRAICFVSVTFPNGGNYRSTGWLFSADGVVVAGHAIYNPERGGWADQVTVYPAKDGNSEPYRATAYEYGIATPFFESQDVNYDYGLLKLEQPIGNTVGYLGYTYNGGAVNNAIRTIGYPAIVDENGNVLKKQYESFGTVLSVDTNRIYHNADSAGGQSGGPILLGNTAIGVSTHINSATNINKGKRIHYDMYAWMNEW